MDSIRLLRINDVCKKTTFARSTIWLKISQGLFPKGIKLSTGVTVWKESIVDEWIEAKFNQVQS